MLVKFPSILASFKQMVKSKSVAVGSSNGKALWSYDQIRNQHLH